MSLTRPERETIITVNDEDGSAEIYTAQRPWITKLRKNPAATLIEYGDEEVLSEVLAVAAIEVSEVDPAEPS